MVMTAPVIKTVRPNLRENVASRLSFVGNSKSKVSLLVYLRKFNGRRKSETLTISEDIAGSKASEVSAKFHSLNIITHLH